MPIEEETQDLHHNRTRSGAAASHLAHDFVRDQSQDKACECTEKTWSAEARVEEKGECGIPRAVVVKYGHAAIAYPAVLGPGRPPNLRRKRKSR